VTSPGESSARQVLQDTLNEWGLGTLYGDVDSLIKEGLDQSAVLLQLQNTDAYKQRFAANEQRRQKGLPVLSPAEYIATEASYKTVLRTYGLPESFYDQQDDLHQFLANDVSPQELQNRAQIAQELWLGKDEESKAAWRSAYGFSDGAAIAAILDPNRAMPILERMATAARIGGAATRNGLETDIGRFEKYADMGVTADQAAQGMSQIGQSAQADAAIAQRFGTTFTQEEQEQDRILGLASAKRKRDRLYDSEKQLFSESAGASETSMGRRTTGSY
jgi:hypothetical protein